MERIRLKVSDWTRFPGGRFREDGEHSGQEFREEFIDPAIASGSHIEVDFNGIFTVGWSFLDETFGHYFSKLGEDAFQERFTVIADDDPDILRELNRVIAKLK